MTLKYFSYFPQKTGLDNGDNLHEMSKPVFNLSCPEFANRVAKVEGKYGNILLVPACVICGKKTGI